jgi:hypothetical protein
MAYPIMSTLVPWSLVKNGFHKTPHFNSQTQKPAAGRGRTSISFMPYGTWDFEVDLFAVRGGEAIANSVLQSFLGCYIACCGGGGFFLFTDPNDSVVTQDNGIVLNTTPGAPAPMGRQGDGVSTAFQLARTIDQGVDILQNVTGAEVYVNGVPAPGTLSATGVYTFTTAPAADAMISWDGTFQYLCQFTDDTLKGLSRTNKNKSGFLWECSSITFESVFI